MWNKLKRSFLKRKNDKLFDYLIVGLGNPGKKYEKTIHNTGFRVLSNLQKRESFPSFEKDKGLDALITKGEIEGKKTILFFPLTFMNHSGRAVRGALGRFVDSPKKIIVIHDDTDIPLGVLKISLQKGSAGHKGIESIINHLKTKEFIRFRVGVKRKDEKALSLVLKKAPKEMREIEIKSAEKLIKKISTDFSSETVRLF